MDALRAPQHGRQGLNANPGDVVHRLLAGQGDPRGLGVDAAPLGPGVGRAELVAHDSRPQPSGGTELGNFLEEVVVNVEEERQARGEFAHLHPPLNRLPDVPRAVGQRVGKLLDGVGTCFSDVVAADGYCVPSGGLLCAELHRVHHEVDALVDRKQPLLLGDVLLENVVLRRAAKAVQGNSALLGHGEIHCQQNGRGAVDRHGHGNLVDWDAFKQVFHVRERVHRRPVPTHLSLADGVVGVAPHEGRQIEGGGEPCPA